MKIPFAFWGQAESDLPIVTGLKVLNTELTEAELQFTLVDSGENGPVYAYGIVYSKTDPQVTLDTPGAQVSPIGTNFPGTLPVTNTHTVTGLDNTSTYYFRVFATNNQGQPAEENTFYSNTATGETAWDAFTFEYNYAYVEPLVQADQVILGRVHASPASQGFAYNLLGNGTQQITVDKGLGTNAAKWKVQDENTGNLITQGNFTNAGGYAEIKIDKSLVPAGTQKIIVTIAHDNTVPGSTFNNFRVWEEAKFAAIRIRRWGPAKWKTWDYMFEGSNDPSKNPSNNDPAIGTPSDLPDLSECVSWQATFRFNQQVWSGDNQNEQKLGEYDLSNIKVAMDTFRNSNVCSQPASANTQPIKDANWENCQIFDNCFDSMNNITNNSMSRLDLSGWTFNQNDSINMGNMFNGNKIGSNSNYQAGIANWDVSKVLNFESFLANAVYFNEDLGSWDVSHCTNMRTMFMSCLAVNFDASSWVVAQVSDYTNFSLSAIAWVLPQPNFPFIATNSNIGTAINACLAVDPSGNTAVSPYGLISNFNTTNVTNMYELFNAKNQFNADISGWDTSNVTTMEGLFNGAQSFNQDISSWDTSSVTRMDDMFNAANVFNQDIGNWDVSNVTRMERMFFRAYAFNQDISGWDIGSLNSSGYQQGVYQMFYQATSFNTSLNGWDLPATLTNLQGMFYGSGYNAPLDQWDTSNITDMSEMFATSSFNQDISSWDTSSVTNMYKMFESNTAFNQEIGDWDVSSLTNTNQMFRSATAFNKSLANWNAPNLSQIGEMFRQSNFNSPLPDLTLVGDQRGIFYNNTQFNQDISGWDVSGVTLFFFTFRGATSFNQDISSWDVSSCFNFNNMFFGATSFDQNLGPWGTHFGDFSNLSGTGFLNGVTLSTSNYDSILTSWASELQIEHGNGWSASPTFDFGNSVRSENPPVDGAVEVLVEDYNFTITDGNNP